MGANGPGLAVGHRFEAVLPPDPLESPDLVPAPYGDPFLRPVFVAEDVVLEGHGLG